MENPLKTAICEDRPEDAALLVDYISRSGIAAACEVFPSGEELLNGFFAGRYDLIFLDIYMQGMRGIDAAEKIREKDESVVLAFTTTSRDHALESYRLGALKYLEKPVKAAEVKQALSLARANRSSAAYISVMAGGKKTDIPINSILYCEQQDHAVTLNTEGGPLRASQSVKLSAIEPLLPSPQFLRCHQSYVVNLRYVEKLDREMRTFTMKNGGTVYIRRQDIKKTAEAYEDYLFCTARNARDD